MNVGVFSAKSYDRQTFEAANDDQRHQLMFFDARLTTETTRLAVECDAVCVFVNDEVNSDVIHALHLAGVRLIALRCAGFNNVDLLSAQELGIRVVRVPAYSPHAVAEHTVGLMLALNRNIHRAYQRIREGDFRLQGLMGFDFYGRTAGVVGTGVIGTCVARILRGLGCRVLAYDVKENPDCLELGVEYVDLRTLFQESKVITLHCPLTAETRHLINRESISQMQDGVMLINTGRGALVDTQAVIAGLKARKIGSLGMDVYEEEAELFFEDRSAELLQDDVFARLLTFPNTLITGHQGFFTEEALQNIAQTTTDSFNAFESGQPLVNEVLVT